MTGWLPAASAGARIALRRLSGRSTLLITFAAVSFCTLAAWAERIAQHSTAPSLALQGPGFGLAIPLGSLALVSVALSRSRLDESVRTIALLGGNRRAAAFGMLVATSLVSGMLGLFVATATTWIAYGRVDGAMLSDALAAAWIGGLSGGVYVFYYGAASTLGRHGGGRIAAFLADWVLGPMVGAAAVVFPRAHALNLLGAEPVLELPQLASSGILVVMLAVFAVLAAFRTVP